jgi:hypothetical protein
VSELHKLEPWDFMCAVCMYVVVVSVHIMVLHGVHLSSLRMQISPFRWC